MLVTLGRTSVELQAVKSADRDPQQQNEQECDTVKQNRKMQKEQ